MDTIIKVQNIRIKNIKNVKNGEINIPLSFEESRNSNVVGLYGQNGTGKTTVVEAFSILKKLICGWIEKEHLPTTSEKLLYLETDYAILDFDFLVQNKHGEFHLNYYVELQEGKERLVTLSEKLSYRENEKNKKFKTLVSKENNNIQIRTKSLNSFSETLRVKIMVINELAKGQNISFIFHEDLKELLSEQLNDIETELVKNLAVDFNRDLHVINNENIGLLMTKYIMPFSVHLEKTRGFIPYDLASPAVLPEKLYKVLCELIEQNNKVLTTIIPGLEIKINEISNQMNDEGEVGISFEFLSKRGNRELPLRTESEGVLKIISVLSVLIATYNNPNACVVIDELDAGIFEYLLGELLTVIKEGGEGQLIFTSHNLRVLEVLSTKDLWFTTINEENRYIQLKGIKKMNNARDVYLRSIQLGGQDEEVYKKTKTFNIKRAFRKAGVKNE